MLRDLVMSQFEFGNLRYPPKAEIGTKPIVPGRTRKRLFSEEPAIRMVHGRASVAKHLKCGQR